MKNYYYLYITHNLINDKKYIGQHCTHNLNDGYFGSCVKLKEDIKKGDSYKVDIIRFYDNIYDLGNAEFEYIKQTKAYYDDNYYNKNNTRYYNVNFENGPSESTKQKMRDTLKITGGNKGSKNGMHKKGHLISGEKNGMYGKVSATKGRTWKCPNRKPTPKVTCPKCGKVGAPNVMYRFHFDKCGVSNEIYNNKMSDVAKKRWEKIKSNNVK